VESVKLHVPEQYQQQCLKLLLQNHEAVSQDKFNLGRTDTLMHEIALKTEEPIYISLVSFSQPAAATTAQFSPSLRRMALSG